MANGLIYPDIVGSFQQGQRIGTQNRLLGESEQRRSRLADLAQQAYGAQDATQRQGLIGQAVGVDPEAGFAMSKQFSAQEDERTQRLVNNAKLLTSAPEAMRPALWQQVRGSIAQSGIIPESSLPLQYDDTVAQTAQALVQAYGGAQQGNNVQSRFVGEDGMIYALMRDGTTQPLGIKADPNTQIIEGAGGFYGVNKRNLAATPVQIGGGQPQQQSREMPFTIDPSLPPEVQADIRATEASGQAWTQAPMGGGGQLQPSAPRVSPIEAARLRLAQEEAARDQAKFERDQALGGMTPQQAFKLQTAKRKETAMLSSGEAKLDQTISLIDDILARKGDFGGVTGMGAFGARIPGTDWADLANKIETLKARSAFGSLQEMRANSPTGGALGSVTERELALLQNAETQLGNSQSPESFEQALKQYKQQLQNSKLRMRRGLEEFYQDVPQGQIAPAAPQGGRSSLPPGFSWED